MTALAEDFSEVDPVLERIDTLIAEQGQTRLMVAQLLAIATGEEVRVSLSVPR